MVEKTQRKALLIPLLNFSLGGREERGDLNNKVLEHIVQLVALKLISGLILMLHNFYIGCLVYPPSGIDRPMLSGVCFTRLLFNKFWRCLFHTGYQNDLFSSALSQVRFRRYTAAWSPPTFTHTV